MKKADLPVENLADFLEEPLALVDIEALEAKLQEAQSRISSAKSHAETRPWCALRDDLGNQIWKGVALNRILSLGEVRPLKPEIFTERDKNGWPTWVPFELNRRPVEFVGGLGCDLPGHCAEFYRDVYRKLEKRNSYLNCLLFPVLALILCFLGLTYWPAGTLKFFSVINWIAGGVFVVGVVALVSIFFGNNGSGLDPDKVSTEDFAFGIGILLLLAAALWHWSITVIFTLGILSHRCLKRTWWMKARLVGFMPTSVKALRRRADDGRCFSRVFLVARVPKWRVGVAPEAVPTSFKSHLLVGYRDHGYWLISRFDALEDGVSNLETDLIGAFNY
ncbi:MAG: hypothetical protein WC250_04005 [Candidatus Paceibacterota bacterium]|jgi:hypothetical protein